MVNALAQPGPIFPTRGVLVLVVAVDDSHFVLGVIEITEVVNGTLGLKTMTIHIDAVDAFPLI